MKSNSTLTLPGWVFLGTLVYFMIVSGLLVKIGVIVMIVLCLKITMANPTPKEYSKPEKKGKSNLPPALAEKLSRRK